MGNAHSNRQAVLAVLLLLPAGCGAPAPRPSSVQVLEASVSYPVGREVVRGILYQPAAKGPAPALVVVHEDKGLTSWVKEQAKRLADQGYVVLAVDLYRGQRGTDLLEAHILDRALPEERVLGDLKGAVDYLLGRPEVNRQAVGIVGFDSGGGYALDAACRDPRLKTVVICYGRVATEPATVANLQGSVLGIFAGRDEGISPQTIEQFQKAMDRAGKRLTVEVYPECGHGFLNPAEPAGQTPQAQAAARAAWSRIDAHLAAELKR